MHKKSSNTKIRPNMIKLHLCLSVMVGLSSCKPCCGGDQVDCHKKKAVQAAEGFKCISMFGGHCRVIEVTKILSQKHKKKQRSDLKNVPTNIYPHILNIYLDELESNVCDNIFSFTFLCQCQQSGASKRNLPWLLLAGFTKYSLGLPLMTCHNTAHHFPRPRFQQLLAPSHLLLKHYAAPSLKSKQAFINGKMYLLLYLYLYFCKESVGLFLHFEIKICLIFSLFNISSGASLFCIQDQTKLISIPRQTL